MAQIQIQDLTYTYPAGEEKPALDHISLQAEAGEYIVLCGKSGSGKTTLLRHLKTVLTPHGVRTGSVCLEGRPLEEIGLREQASRIGYVMQNPDDQIVTDKVWHELAFGLENLGCEQQEMRRRVAEMACYFGIQDWFHRDVTQLSGGQKQLLNLAAVMVMQPDILILDEPTAQLDPITAGDFLNTVRKINLDLGTTVLITEHRLEEILPVADRVWILENGKVTADTTPRAAGEQLWKQGSDLFRVMPAPVKIYYGAGETAETCPLTVREGRSWLSRLTEVEGSEKCGSEEHSAEKYGAEKRDSEQQGDQKQPREKQFWEERPLALELQEVWFRYEKQAPDVLRGMNLEIPEGSIYAIVGGNGTGKSTALRTLCGISRPWKGRVKLFGEKMETRGRRHPAGDRICMLPQDPLSLFVKKTVRGELEEMSRDPERIRRIAEFCEIDHLLDRHPYDLSGGEQQRTALAKVLMTEPRILLLDEPTKGMDPMYKERFGEHLRELKKQGMTIVMVSHDVEFCARYADLAAMCFDGDIVSSGEACSFFCGNNFYTTAANRMARHCFPEAVTEEDVIAALRRKR